MAVFDLGIPLTESVGLPLPAELGVVISLYALPSLARIVPQLDSASRLRLLSARLVQLSDFGVGERPVPDVHLVDRPRPEVHVPPVEAARPTEKGPLDSGFRH